MRFPSPGTGVVVAVGMLSASIALGLRARQAKPPHFGPAFPADAPVALTTIARDRAAHRGRAALSAGTVTFVCQEKGCWMEVEDAGIEANVRIHEHAFTFPKDAAGKKARFYGVVTYLWEGKPTDDEHLARAQIEFDTTAAELDP